ncbi:MAG: thioredoxin domain-containing protein [Saprospiraceae bacterium]|nr:thioredoxin domain-containing protein [Saprospiraceae bacterium]
MNKLIFALGLVLLVVACTKNTQKMSNSNHKYTNALINESSPYLLQHAHNPVDWHPWNEATLEKAKKEDKLLIISIGYAACHWCHVMEHESFEDSLVAQIMNDNFICIKVDREERPDVDDVYMTACQLASGRACGWPLNAFALPNGKPVWAGTYFPKDQWKKILNQFKTLKEENLPKLEESARKITQGIQNIESFEIATDEKSYALDDLNGFQQKIVSTIDFEHGGKKGAPKFPMPNNYEFLLQHYYMTGDKTSLEAVTITLDKMAYGGIYDQLGGGFARYSTDRFWIVPHFEKMLYDNSQLVSLYSHAYQITKKPLYKKVIEETITFVQRELMNNEFGFYSSLDADSEGEEGKFYVWTSEEIDSIIGNKDEAELIKKYFSIEKNGNWEETNILLVDEQVSAKDFDKSNEEFNQIIQTNKAKLMAARSNRVRPGLDDKILTSWNGLMLKGLIDAYRALGNKEYLDLALKNANFLLNNSFQEGGRLNRNYKDGKSSINAFLDDYATVSEAFIALYEVTFDLKWLEKAKELSEYTMDHFYNGEKNMFFYTSDIDPALIARKMELTDNVIPASNSIMARNLFKLGTLMYDTEMVKVSKQMINNMNSQIFDNEYPSYYSNWCQLIATMVKPPYEVAILGNEAVEKSNKMQRSYLPNSFFLGGATEEGLELLTDKLQEDRTMIYVCQNKVCKLPVEDADRALTLID